MKNELFIAAGAALYGTCWQRQLSNRLGVHERTVRRWIADKHPVPSGVYADLMRIANERIAELVKIDERLQDHFKNTPTEDSSDEPRD